MLDAWVCERQGEILGHVAIATVPRNGMSRVRWQEITGQETDRLARVSRLFVRRRVRGQGIATVLLDVAVDEIRARELTPVLDVVSTSTDGVALLEARKWRLVASDPWGSTADRHRVHFYTASPLRATGARSGQQVLAQEADRAPHRQVELWPERVLLTDVGAQPYGDPGLLHRPRRRACSSGSGRCRRSCRDGSAPAR